MSPLIRILFLVVFTLAGGALPPALAFQPNGKNAIGTIAATALPPEARQTLALIKKGGPFPYNKDGTVFGNRERILPAKPRGHYREYTVKTPGAKNRGARRIVAGGGIYYYTDDHYASFKRIQESP
ncbi:MAG: ribonuclease [Betaproteobacteria bacterium]|nr:ribonuclease [Betaproteobacteria bacterium]